MSFLSYFRDSGPFGPLLTQFRGPPPVPNPHPCIPPISLLTPVIVTKNSATQTATGRIPPTKNILPTR